MPSRACTGPNRLRKPVTSMVASMVMDGRRQGRAASSRWGAVAVSHLRGRPGRPTGTIIGVMRASGRVRGWMPELFAVLAVTEIGGRLGFTHSATRSQYGILILQQTSSYIAGSPVRLPLPGVLVLLVLCLLMTMALRLRPAAAVVVITAATVVSLTVFQVLAVGG